MCITKTVANVIVLSSPLKTVAYLGPILSCPQACDCGSLWNCELLSPGPLLLLLYMIPNPKRQIVMPWYVFVAHYNLLFTP